MSLRFPAFALAVVLAAGLATRATAQIAPNDTGAGTKRGMQEMSTSGQVGTVTLFGRGSSTLVVIDLHSVPAGRQEPAHIHRGKACDDVDPKPAFSLAPIVEGTSRTLVQYSIGKLLSGNYSVIVHASDAHLEHFVSCGHLY